MYKHSITYKIYFLLIIILAILALISVYLPQSEQIPMQSVNVEQRVLALVNFGIIILIYTPLGYIGLRISEKMDIIVDESANYRVWLKKTIIVGGSLGIAFIILDLIFASVHGLGRLPHPPFWTSIIASVTAAIGEEIIFRLFFITFWYWIIGKLLFKEKYNSIIFWSISLLSAFAFTVTHLPSIIFLYGFEDISQISLSLLIELLLMNGSLSLFAAYYYRKFGIFAAMNIHFVLDLVWHVLWGLV